MVSRTGYNKLLNSLLVVCTLARTALVNSEGQFALCVSLDHDTGWRIWKRIITVTGTRAPIGTHTLGLALGLWAAL